MRAFVHFILRGSIFALLGCGSLAYATDVTIYDRATRQTLPMYTHHGRMYIIGEPGHEYEIRINNRSPQRMLAVTTVDGINVITGETASVEQSGYVLDAYSAETIEGWRKSMSHTAAFFFTSVANSYAGRTGRGEQTGVIGVALFRERLHIADGLTPLNEASAKRAAPSAPSAKSDQSRAADSQDKFELGTGHGASEYSAARYTHFERASQTPDETIAIYYDSRRNLIAQGIVRDVEPRHYAQRRPHPFPNSPGEWPLTFTPDPE